MAKAGGGEGWGAGDELGMHIQTLIQAYDWSVLQTTQMTASIGNR